MSYEIKNVEIDSERAVLTTEVEFTLKDGTTKTINVDHFSPQTKEDVICGIENMEICENKNLDIPDILEGIKNELIA